MNYTMFRCLNLLPSSVVKGDVMPFMPVRQNYSRSLDPILALSNGPNFYTDDVSRSSYRNVYNFSIRRLTASRIVIL